MMPGIHIHGSRARFEVAPVSLLFAASLPLTVACQKRRKYEPRHNASSPVVLTEIWDHDGDGAH